MQTSTCAKVTACTWAVRIEYQGKEVMGKHDIVRAAIIQVYKDKCSGHNLQFRQPVDY